MFENQQGQQKANEPQDIFANTVPMSPVPSQGGGGTSPETLGADIPELAGPVFSPGKLWTTIGIIVVVLSLVAGGVWWFWWMPQQTNVPDSVPFAEVVTDSQIQPQSQPVPPPVLDTDGDGLTDTEEQQLRTNVANQDSDTDGLGDKEEVHAWKTNPLKADSDGDGYTDKQEIDNGYNPNGSGKLVNEQEDIKKLQQPF